MLVVLVIVSFLSFSLMHLVPGDPAVGLLGEDATPEQVAALREQLGLDRPLLVQYSSWVLKAIKGDLGVSLRTGQPITEAIAARIKPTIQLNIMALLFALIVGIPLGILAAARHESILDGGSTALAMVGVAMPNFWLGILLMLVFSIWLDVLPPMGYVDPAVNLRENLLRMVMPSITLGVGLAAIVTRQTRSSVLEVLREDFVRTARSKGVAERVILLRHVLRNALVPVITVVGMSVGRLMGGAVVTEFIFSIPGIGRLALDAVFTRDYPAVQGVVLIMAVGVLMSYFLVDVAYTVIDPRVRYD